MALKGRIGDAKTLQRQVSALEAERNAKGATINGVLLRRMPDLS